MGGWWIDGVLDACSLAGCGGGGVGGVVVPPFFA